LIKAEEHACRDSLRTFEFIHNPQKKKNLCNLLSESFCNLRRQQLPPDKTLFIGGGFKNGRWAVTARSNHYEDVNDLESDHKKTDTR